MRDKQRLNNIMYNSIKTFTTMLSNSAVIENFMNNVESHNRNLESVFSYSGDHGIRLVNYWTAIAQKIGGVIVVNGTRYSASTSKVQCYLRRALIGHTYVEINNVPIGTLNLTECYEKHLKEQGKAA